LLYPRRMPPITALLHTTNDALRLGRALETLFPCAEILVIDHASVDATRRIARAYGARIVAADKSTARRYLDLASNDWIFCMEPMECISEGLQASLFEWAAGPSESIGDFAFDVVVRRQVGELWLEAALGTRLISRRSPLCSAMFGEEIYLPAREPAAVALKGELLRFDFP
jgi:hypothetical protein